MAFRFPLASVLNFRESMERREELALKKILLEMAHVQREIDRLTAELAAAQRMREESLQRPIPAFQLQAMMQEADAAVERKRVLLESLTALERQRAEQTRVYQAAHRGRRMLSELLEQQHELWEQEQARAQQKAVDDVFASRNQRG